MIRIPVTFGYIPLSRPPPLSTLRRLSYQENAPLLGPTVDIEGWHRVDPVDVNGTLFNDRAVNVKCTVCIHVLFITLNSRSADGSSYWKLYLAKPVSFFLAV